MKQLVVLAGFAVLLSGILGCQDANRITDKAVDANEQFPAFLAGTWKAEGRPWKITLNPDGTVASAVIPMAKVEVKPNQTTKVEMKDGSFSTFKAGDCIVEYMPGTKELFVSVEMEHIHITYQDNVIDGNSIDRFVGPVSEDGKVWTADWISIFDYGPRFPQDPNDIFAEPLIFKKLED